MPSLSKLRITWVKSTIGSLARHRATVRALGLRRLHQTVFHNDTPTMRGMLHAVRHLVTVTPATEEEVAAASAPAAAKQAKFELLSGPPAEAPVRRDRRAAGKAKAAAEAKPSQPAAAQQARPSTASKRAERAAASAAAEAAPAKAEADEVTAAVAAETGQTAKAETH